MKRRLEVEKLARQRTKARSAKEEADRVARAVTGVNHIDIPAELAFIFSKLDGETTGVVCIVGFEVQTFYCELAFIQFTIKSLTSCFID